MDDELKIEKLSGENFNEFIKLVEIFANFEKLTPPDKNAKKRLKIDGIGKNPKYEAYLVKTSGKYAAYTIFYMAYSSFSAMPKLFVEDIFILEEFRRKGLGKKILDFIVGIAKKSECMAVDLNVLDWNTNAILFYKKHGFKYLNWELYRLELQLI